MRLHFDRNSIRKFCPRINTDFNYEFFIYKFTNLTNLRIITTTGNFGNLYFSPNLSQRTSSLRGGTTKQSLSFSSLPINADTKPI